MLREFKQLVNVTFHVNPIVESIKTSELTPEDKTKALNAISLIKIKQKRVVKGRSCTDGNEEQFYLKEEQNVALSTVALESFISTLIVDVFEGRAIATFDIPGTYLYILMPKESHVTQKFCGKCVDSIYDVNPEFKQHIMYEKGIKCHTYESTGNLHLHQICAALV
eukprot:6328966-Ditylum_brightwellii.AAC.1